MNSPTVRIFIGYHDLTQKERQRQGPQPTMTFKELRHKKQNQHEHWATISFLFLDPDAEMY